MHVCYLSLSLIYIKGKKILVAKILTPIYFVRQMSIKRAKYIIKKIYGKKKLRASRFVLYWSIAAKMYCMDVRYMEKQKMNAHIFAQFTHKNA